MAVPSASWPHAVFPGLSGNKGRKTPFYSITPAALGHWANTKESGFIKTISARNEPNRLIYHQPCREYEELRGHRDTPVLRGYGCFPDSAHEGYRHLSQLMTRVYLAAAHAFLGWVWWIWRNLTATPDLVLKAKREKKPNFDSCVQSLSFLLSKPRKQGTRKSLLETSMLCLRGGGDLGRIHMGEEGQKEWKGR